MRSNKTKRVYLSIQNKILLLSGLSILLPVIIIASISTSITARILKDKISETNHQMSIQVRENLDFLMMEIEKSVEILIENKDVQNFFHEEQSKKSDTVFVYETNKVIEKLFNKLVINKSEISYINLSTPNNQFVFESPEGGVSIPDPINIYTTNREKLYDLLEEKGKDFFWQNEIYINPEHSLKNRIYYVRILKDKQTNSHIGVLVVGVSKDLLSEKLSSNIDSHDQNFFVINDKDKPIFILNSDMETLDKKKELTSFLSKVSLENTDSDVLKIENVKYLVSRSYSDYSGWETLNMVPFKRIVTSVDSLKLTAIYLSVICMLLSVSFAIVLSNRITLPIKKLTLLVNRVKEGGWDASFPRGKGDTDPALKNTLEEFLGLKGSFRNILIKYFLIITIIPLGILNFTLYRMSMKIVEQEVSSSMVQSMDYINKRVKLSLESAEQSSKFLFSNQIIQEGILRHEKSELEEKLEIEKAFQELFLQEQSLKQNMAYIGIFSLEGIPLFSSLNVYYNKENIKDQEWFEFAQTTQGEAITTNTYRDNLGKDVISMVRKINNVMQYTTNVGHPIGYLLISYYENFLESTYKNINFGESGDFFIVDENQVILSNKDKNLLGKKIDSEIWNSITEETEPITKTILGEKYLMFNDTVSNTGWKLVGMLPIKELVSWNKNIFQYNLYILIITFFVVLFMALAFSTKLSIPIVKLSENMKQMKDGEFPENISINSKDEIGELADSFNSMVKKLKELIEEVYEAKITSQQAEIRQKEAELNTLQAQINPHFLYNTLETINWIAIDVLGGENDISNTVIALSNLLRSTISKGDMVVPIEKQLKEVEEYLFIQKMRYEDKFNVIWELEDEIKQFQMLSMVIQPIVENAIVHGIEKMEEGGEIFIKGWVADGKIFFEIRDNGGGMDLERLKEIREQINNEEIMPFASIGLRNTHQRLKHYYGEKYGLQIESIPGQYTKVTICSPAIML